MAGVVDDGDVSVGGVVDDGDFSYNVSDTHLYFRLEEGSGFRNLCTIRVYNTGKKPLWVHMQDYKCSVYTEGFDILYTFPILPGESRLHSVKVFAVPYQHGQRASKAVFKKSTFATLDFNLGVYDRVPDGFDAPRATTVIYCSLLVPAGMSYRYKIVRYIELEVPEGARHEFRLHNRPLPDMNFA
jgi:hypothetical protein